MSQKKTKKRKEDFTQEAYMGIRRMFFNNEIIPGQKISYRDLAERPGMSATPIIQALKRLEFQGLVSMSPIVDIIRRRPALKRSLKSMISERSLRWPWWKKPSRRSPPGNLQPLKKRWRGHLSAVRDVYLKDRLLRDREFHMAPC